MSEIERRIKALEQAQQGPAKEEWVTTDGAEYGLEPCTRGWTVLLRNGKVFKAWGNVSPRDWPERGA